MDRLCVYCGSRVGARPEYGQAAAALGRLLAARGIALVFGGGRVGLMGILADAVLQAGGSAIGVIPQALVDKELAHNGLSELRVVGSMHERKAMMANLSDAFIALPGGLGTLEELLEVWTWAQLGLHAKPCGVLDVAGYFEPLAAFLDRAVAEGFVRPEHRAMLHVDRAPEALLDRLAASLPPTIPEWIDASTI